MTSTRVEDFKLEDWLPFWISPDDLIAFLAACAVLIAFIAIWQALRPTNPFDRRYSQIVQRREGLRHAAPEIIDRSVNTAAGAAAIRTAPTCCRCRTSFAASRCSARRFSAFSPPTSSSRT
jgi:hypothetical protein